VRMGTRIIANVALNIVRNKFPVFPVEPGISPIFPMQPLFRREDGEANQALASERTNANREFAPGPTGN
jgi:hypothetical protein